MISVKVEDRWHRDRSPELKHIFEPFYRSPKVMESPVPGTGLGLSLARSFAEAMGGWLTVESEPGEGKRLYDPFACRERIWLGVEALRRQLRRKKSSGK